MTLQRQTGRRMSSRRNPPDSTKFKPGKSGNPRGRPKGSRGHRQIVASVVNAKVWITENGKRSKKTKFELALTQQTNKAAQGDIKSFLAMLEVMARYSLIEADPSAADRKIDDRDEPVVEDIVRRLLAMRFPKSNHDDGME